MKNTTLENVQRGYKINTCDGGRLQLVPIFLLTYLQNWQLFDNNLLVQTYLVHLSFLVYFYQLIAINPVAVTYEILHDLQVPHFLYDHSLMACIGLRWFASFFLAR